jgi:hypothetical protein
VTRPLRWLAAAVALVVASFPAPAVACPVCFWGQSNSMVAYVATAVFLSMLPLAMIGAIVLWIRRRLRDERAPMEPGSLSS